MKELERKRAEDGRKREAWVNVIAKDMFIVKSPVWTKPISMQLDRFALYLTQAQQ